jgi:hypothetical protein
MHLHSTTIPQPRSNHYSTIILVELETTETTCKNNILFPAAKPRGALETAGVLPAVEVVLSVVNVVSFMTKPLLNRKTARRIYRALFTARPETADCGVSTRFRGHSTG